MTIFFIILSISIIILLISIKITPFKNQYFKKILKKEVYPHRKKLTKKYSKTFNELND